MLNLGCVEVGADQLARISFGKGEDGALDHRPLRQAQCRTEVLVTGSAIVVGKRRGDEGRCGGDGGAREGLNLARLQQLKLDIWRVNRQREKLCAYGQDGGVVVEMRWRRSPAMRRGHGYLEGWERVGGDQTWRMVNFGLTETG